MEGHDQKARLAGESDALFGYKFCHANTERAQALLVHQGNLVLASRAYPNGSNLWRGRMSFAVIFGAAGGIGAALVDAAQRSGRFSSVLGFSRRSIPSLDLCDEGTIREAAFNVSKIGAPSLVIVATGLLHKPGMAPEKTFRAIDPGQMADAFAVNAIGPALIMKHVLPLMPRHELCVFAVLSAKVGSIEDNRLGGWHSYRASKAALNQLVRTTAVELRRSHPAAICVAVHPGTVNTGLSERFAKSGLQVQRPQDAAQDILACLSKLTPGQSGSFVDRFGTPIPW